MAEETAPNKTPRFIVPDDVTAFFTAKNVDERCPRCPNNNWTLIESSEVHGIAPAALNSQGNTNMALTFPMLPIVCTNCAFVWLIARGSFEEWLTERDRAK